MYSIQWRDAWTAVLYTQLYKYGATVPEKNPTYSLFQIDWPMTQDNFAVYFHILFAISLSYGHTTHIKS